MLTYLARRRRCRNADIDRCFRATLVLLEFYMSLSDCGDQSEGITSTRKSRAGGMYDSVRRTSRNEHSRQALPAEIYRTFAITANFGFPPEVTSSKRTRRVPDKFRCGVRSCLIEVAVSYASRVATRASSLRPLSSCRVRRPRFAKLKAMSSHRALKIMTHSLWGSFRATDLQYNTGYGIPTACPSHE